MLIACSSAIAQSKTMPTANQGQTPFKLFFEKVYLHTDRDFYASGDDIWFKAYLVNGESNYPTYTSNNLYVDLISPDSKIMSRVIIRLDSGMGHGDFKLRDSIPGGIYRLRAYTSWMRNFGDHFIFDKQITVNSVAGIKATSPVVSKKRPKKKTDSEEDTVTNTCRISFFPEGGSLVQGIMGVVGFKAEDGLGKGVKVSGSVVAMSGEAVGQFASTDAGLGSFTMMPIAGATYQVRGRYANGEEFAVDLPEVLTEGYALHIKNTDPAYVQVTVSANQPMFDQHKGKSLTLVAKHGDKTYFDVKFTLTDLQASINIPKAKFPAGVTSIILSDELMRPNCERLIYVEGKSDIKFTVTPDKPIYAPKEKTTLTISVTNAQNQPVKANLSLAAVDGSIVPVEESNISSYLLLQADVRGKIENAAQYFDPANVNRFKQIDLLLLTQGWRDFVWKRLADSTLKLSYLPEAGFTISGRLRSVMINKSIPNMNITLFAPEAKGDKLFGTKTDANGKYYFDHIELYGTQTLRLSSRDDKGHKSGWLFLDTIGHDALPVKQLPFINEPPSSAVDVFNLASTARMKNVKNSRLLNGIQLNEVEITDMHTTVTTFTGQILTTFGPQYDHTVTAADYHYKDLEDFLLEKAPGAKVNTGSGEGVIFIFGRRKISPHFVINNREELFTGIDYYALSMDQVISVKVAHYVDFSSRDRIWIYLTLKPTAFDRKEFNLINADVTGYYSARTFYSPNYEYSSTKVDQRITLYWEPMISTDANGQATVTYYNADPKSKIRVVVQGLTDKGVPLTTTANYTIK